MSLDGVLVVAKPVGPTSHDVVGLIRRLAATKRVGHGGTLDPFAAGVLPVFLGKATRLVEYHLGDRKRYRATVCFGASSTTDDLEGALTPAAGPAPSRTTVETALAGFRGPIEQRPPAYIAIKVSGRRAYAPAHDRCRARPADGAGFGRGSGRDRPGPADRGARRDGTARPGDADPPRGRQRPAARDRPAHRHEAGTRQGPHRCRGSRSVRGLRCER